MEVNARTITSLRKYREGEKVRHRMLEYLGTNPTSTNMSIDVTTAAKVASKLFGSISPSGCTLYTSNDA